MKFTVINDGFQCGNCSATVPPHPTSCRNHCTACLFSMHLDLKMPGDRAANCGALMPPVGLDYKGKKGWMLIHQCSSCGHQQKNMVSEDDNQDLIAKL